MFGARDELKGQLARQLAPKAEQRLVPILLHPARSLGIGDFGEIARRGVERIKARDIVQRVERGFRRQLPVAAQHLPLIFAAPDGLARSEEHTYDLHSLMRRPYADFSLK